MNNVSGSPFADFRMGVREEVGCLSRGVLGVVNQVTSCVRGLLKNIGVGQLPGIRTKNLDDIESGSETADIYPAYRNAKHLVVGITDGTSIQYRDDDLTSISEEELGDVVSPKLEDIGSPQLVLEDSGLLKTEDSPSTRIDNNSFASEQRTSRRTVPPLNLKYFTGRQQNDSSLMRKFGTPPSSSRDLLSTYRITSSEESSGRLAFSDEEVLVPPLIPPETLVPEDWDPENHLDEQYVLLREAERNVLKVFARKIVEKIIESIPAERPKSPAQPPTTEVPTRTGRTDVSENTRKSIANHVARMRKPPTKR